jgi:hypothetical protein
MYRVKLEILYIHRRVAPADSEMNGDSKSTNERVPTLVPWACRAGTGDFVLP